MVEACDCTIVIDNSAENGLPSWEGRRSDDLASLAVGGLSSLASRMSQIQKQQFQKIISLGPIATLCSSPVKPPETIQTAILTALRNPSARLPINEARGGILMYTGPEELSTSNAALAYQTVASLVGHDIEFSYASLQFAPNPAVCLLLTGYEYGLTVRAFVEFIEDLYDTEYGQPDSGSMVGLQIPLFQMEQA